MTRLARYSDRAISILHYLLAGLTVLGGMNAVLAPVMPVSGPLGFLYGTRAGLVLFGIVVILCALSLLYGKIRKSRQWTGRGLMACYCTFLFATIVQVAAFGFAPQYWVLNGLFAIISGLFWLKWKFKTEYIDPKEFAQDIIDLG